MYSNLGANAADGLGAGAAAGGLVSGPLALAVAGVVRACGGMGCSRLRGHSHKASTTTRTAPSAPTNNFCPALFILQLPCIPPKIRKDTPKEPFGNLGKTR